ncbi:hypothetical protein L2W42_21650 (plasmid) [Rhizobium gallicum]|nr:group II intron maturase-specific domain-containing protein [Rhizobium gallicum]ULJ74561.1 hypothetical protein L2W42_21650 [Rhizobium gallicum]
MKSLLDKIRKVIKENASATQEALIRTLNPILRGWAMYHHHIVAKATFSSVDSHIWRRLRQWACRRHPTKGARWIKPGTSGSTEVDHGILVRRTASFGSSAPQRSQSRDTSKSKLRQTHLIQNGALTSPAVKPQSVLSSCSVPHHGAEEMA